MSEIKELPKYILDNILEFMNVFVCPKCETWTLTTYCKCKNCGWKGKGK